MRLRYLFVVIAVFALLPFLKTSAGSAKVGSDDSQVSGGVVITQANDGETVQAQAGQYLVVVLSSNVTTGYHWEVAGYDANILQPYGTAQYRALSNQIGAPGEEIFYFKTRAAGATQVKLMYRRPWETGVEPVQNFAVQAVVSGAYREYAVPEPPPANAPAGSLPVVHLPAGPQAATRPEDFTGNLPESFTWWDADAAKSKVTPVKDQGDCGSCWAFSTVAPFESSIRIKDGVTRDLSEQYLLSCNSYHYTCNGGNFEVHNMHVNPGSVYESDFPYTARDDACKPSLTYREKLPSWGYVTNSYSKPTFDQLKKAIYIYGPISAMVCTDNDWDWYTSAYGIYSHETTCTNTVNHGITLVGWNDSPDDSKDYLILKNSWGNIWGVSGAGIAWAFNNGYMYIKPNIDNVGFGAAYVEYGTLPPKHGPSNLAGSYQYGKTSLTWADASDDETGFLVESSPAGQNKWLEIATLGSDRTSYDDPTLSCTSGSYQYRVRAFNAGGRSLYSNTVTVTPKCVPAAPSDIAAQSIPNTQQINVSWVDNSNNEDGFTLVRRRLGDEPTDWAPLTNVGANVTFYANTELPCSTSFAYMVESFNSGGSSLSAFPGVATTAACAITAPSGLSAATVSATQIKLTWSDTSANEEGFRIERAPAGSATWAEVSSVGKDLTTYTDSNLTCAASYQYRVRAKNGGSYSAYSNTATGSTQACGPNAISNLKATPIWVDGGKSGLISLSWTDNSTDEDGFTIYMRRVTNETQLTKRADVGPNIAYNQVGPLACLSTYAFAVEAFNAGGKSALSPEVTAQTYGCEVPAPGGLTAARVSPTSVRLDWTDDNPHKEGFRVERAPLGSETWTEVAALGSNVKTYVDTIPNSGMGYQYRVRSYNGGSTSAYSNTAKLRFNPMFIPFLLR